MSSKQKSVILDVDVGTDDAWAILLLLNNEKRANYKIKAITCVYGNSSVKNIGKNVLRVLETVDRLDVSSYLTFNRDHFNALMSIHFQIPVYLGCDEPLVTHDPSNKNVHFHGVDGLCDIAYDSEPNIELLQKSHAISAMHDLILKEENVTVICLGPLTNLALLYKMYPESREKIKEIFIMGGNRHGVGNITRAAEFNFYCDPEAAFIVLQSSKPLIKLLPLETVRSSKPIPKTWRFDVIGKFNNKITNFLNPIEEKAYKKFDEWTPFDTFCAAAFIDPSIALRTENFHMTIELSGIFTRGQVIIDHINEVNYKNVTVIEEIDVEKFKLLVMNTVVEASK